MHCRCLLHRDILLVVWCESCQLRCTLWTRPYVWQVSACWVQVHGSLLQVRHLLEAHGASLQSCEAQAVLPQTAGLLLERLWLATPLSSAKAVRAAFLRAAGALLSAANSAEAHEAESNCPAVSALARGVMGVCQEALIGQEQPPEPACLPRTPASPPPHDLSRPRIAQAAAQAALPAGSAVAGSNGLADSSTSSYTPARTAYSQSHVGDRGISGEGSSLPSHKPKSESAGADGADMMRSVFLKEAALLYFSPTVQRLTEAGPTGAALCPRQHETGERPQRCCVKTIWFTASGVGVMSCCRAESCCLLGARRRAVRRWL